MRPWRSARRPPPAPAGLELRETFECLEAWTAFEAAHPEIRDAAAIDAIVARGRVAGIESVFLGRVPPDGIAVRSTNYREDFVALGFNPRQRAVMDLFAEDPRSTDHHDLRIYAHEATTPLALAFRGRYTRFLGSEYAPPGRARDWLFPIPVIDIARSGLPDAIFDVVLSIDVFEHLAELDAALRDTARIVVPGGRLIATFPFLFGAETARVRAVLEDGVVRHLAEPEYHGNPADPAAGSLVFQVPGWDILARARAAGFGEARMVFWSSARRGLTGAEIAGIFMLDARR